jgi:hypothetical protein
MAKLKKMSLEQSKVAKMKVRWPNLKNVAQTKKSSQNESKMAKFKKCRSNKVK